MALQALLSKFEVHPSTFQGIIEDIHRQMEDGLAGRPSSLKMIPSYADAATGREEGKFLALDFGGTNLRIVMVHLHDGKIVDKIISSNNRLNEKTPLGADLFRQVAAHIVKFLDDHHLKPAAGEPALPLGFTFSFPVNQTSISSGTLIYWTKEFIASGVEGNDVVALLRTALHEVGLDQSINVVALVNDTVGTMAAHSFEHPETAMGVIMGTGTNACYRESISQIPKLHNPPAGKSHTIINMEWGNYDHMPATEMDELLFTHTGQPALMRFEKMTSGRYMGLLMREVITKCIADGVLFPALPQGAGWVFDPESRFDAMWMDRILTDRAPYPVTRGYLLQCAGRPADDNVFLDANHLEFLLYLSRAILSRSARFAGLMVAAVVARLYRQAPTRAMVVAVDGSVFHKSPGYDTLMQETVTQALHAADGSGVGAAVIAATAVAHQ
ncbi:Hexokinase [Paratrimastix pyriformis]|uniref:Phosphotransferase n=1 Tax=Paratrimastix pyriformis TaxID=342808 RepID=A0ABQ8UK26_9EUKA|nr:Hexokinase [Paratrimastix pyriformis]